MRAAFLSDIHGNMEALDAVLANIESRGGVDAYYHVGDIAGYGPEPEACINRLKALSAEGVLGNHDAAVVNKTDTAFFNNSAKAAVELQKGWLSDEAAAYINALPMTMHIEAGDIMLVHASPYDPEAWHYVLSQDAMLFSFETSPHRITMVGHTHVPFVTELTSDNKLITHGRGLFTLKEGSRYLINPGSVGQPRDHDARASYAIMDGADIEIVRVDYNIEATIKRMVELGLPVMLRERLRFGA